MTKLLALALGLITASCTGPSGRIQTLTRAPSYRAKSFAIVSVRDPKGFGDEIIRSLTLRLETAGQRGRTLDGADSVLAGTPLSLGVAVDPRILDEIRNATGAEAVVFVAMDADWTALDLAAIDTGSGQTVLRAQGRPKGKVFLSPDEAGITAAEALAALSPEKRGKPAVAAILLMEPERTAATP